MMACVYFGIIMLAPCIASIVVVAWYAWNIYDMIRIRNDVKRNGRNSVYAPMFKEEYLDLVEGKD